MGNSVYTNPVNGTQVSFPNVPGHAQVPDNNTACPGVKLAALLPDIRTSVKASAGTPDRDPPTVPLEVTAKSASRSVVLDWADSTDIGSGGGASGLAGYDVYRQSGGRVTRLGSTPTSSYTDTSPKRGSTYHVRSFDGAGNRSGPSASVS